MNTLRLCIAAALAAAVIMPMLAAGDRASALRPKIPPSGDCRAMAASGLSNIWYGQFSGRYESMVDDRVYPLAARGCFRSERECRRWTNQMLSLTENSALMSCRPYR